METFQMNNKEANQISVFKKLQNREIKQKEAGMILGLSTRQIKRKLKMFRRFGVQALIHSSRGRPSNNRIDSAIRENIVCLIENKYPDFGPTLAAEKLQENHNLAISRETLRKAMISAGLWKAKKKKPTHRQWRERKECFGELIQLDGSDHNWFETRAPRSTLLAFIDDATSRLVHLEFAPETTIGVMGATKRYIQKYGLPHEFYVDRGKVFKVNLNNEEEDKITQYRRAVEELGGKLVYARSPQAKGRVERLFGTLQDRLVKELRLRGISTAIEANEFIQKEFLPFFNGKFAVEPKSKTDLHRRIEGYNLAEIFTVRETRILTCDFTIRYRNKWYQLEKKQKTLIFPKNEIIVKTNLDGKVCFSIRKTNLFFHEIDKPTKTENVKSIKPIIEKTPWKPAANHPWRNYKVNYQPKGTFLLC